MQVNGHHGPVPPPDHTSILFTIASTLGRLDAKMDVMMASKRSTVLQDIGPYIAGMVILGSAAAGKVTWSEALPSLLGLVGR